METLDQISTSGRVQPFSWREACRFPLKLLTFMSVVALLFMGLVLIGVLAYGVVGNYQLHGSWVSPVLLANQILYLVFVGWLFALMASLLAWPPAMATAVILAYESQSFWARAAAHFFRSLTFLPSLVYGFVFCWFMGPFLQNNLLEAWLHFFRVEGTASQLLAFALTLLGFPLTIFFPSHAPTIDALYQQNLSRVVEVAQGSFSAFVIAISLAFLLLPTFVTLLYRSLITSKNSTFIEAARAIGATDWEAMTVAIIHSMRHRFSSVFVFGLVKAFVEGVSVFIVLNFFFVSGNWHKFFWAETFSAFFIKTLLFHSLTWIDYLYFAGILLLINLLFSYWSRGLLLSPDEELIR